MVTRQVSGKGRTQSTNSKPSAPLSQQVTTGRNRPKKCLNPSLVILSHTSRISKTSREDRTESSSIAIFSFCRWENSSYQLPWTRPPLPNEAVSTIIVHVNITSHWTEWILLNIKAAVVTDGFTSPEFLVAYFCPEPWLATNQQCDLRKTTSSFLICIIWWLDERIWPPLRSLPILISFICQISGLRGHLLQPPTL